MTMAALLNTALEGKTLTNPRIKVVKAPSHAFVRPPSSPQREMTGRWFAFNTPRNGRVSRQGKNALIVPKAWIRVGDQTGYATPHEAMIAPA